MARLGGYMDDWESALEPYGVGSFLLPSIVEALRAVSIEPSEIRELIAEYPRLGPQAPRPFPGFGFGDEKQIAAELDVVREKLRDPSRRQSNVPSWWYD